MPVVYRLDGSGIFFGGWNLAKTLKFRNISVNNQVACVVHDIVIMKPWKAKGVEVMGEPTHLIMARVPC